MNDKQMHDAYIVSFKVGVVGAVILFTLALLGDILTAMVALSVWGPMTMFVLPWLYVLYCDKEPLSTFSKWKYLKE